MLFKTCYSNHTTYAYTVFSSIYRNMEIDIQDEELFTLDFVDYQVILAEHEDNVCYTPRRFKKEYHKRVLTINTNKAEYDVVEIYETIGLYCWNEDIPTLPWCHKTAQA